MQAVSAPVSVRRRAAQIITAHLPGHVTTKRTVAEAGTEAFCDLLVRLEAEFGIALEVHETWGFTVEQLIDLVDLQVRSRARRALLPPANDDAPGQPAPWLRRAPIVPPAPVAHAVRADRLFAREARARRDLSVIATLTLLGAALGALAAVAAFLTQAA